MRFRSGRWNRWLASSRGVDGPELLPESLLPKGDRRLEPSGGLVWFPYGLRRAFSWLALLAVIPPCRIAATGLPPREAGLAWQYLDRGHHLIDNPFYRTRTRMNDGV